MEINEAIKKEALRRGYSPKTIKTYCYCVERFFRYCNKEPKKVTKKDIREFLDKLVKKNKAGNTINVYLNSLKFLFEDIFGKKMRLNIKYSKVPKKLPIILTKHELKKLFDAIVNEKHKLMIQLMYSTGLRVSELVNLKIKDLELERNYGWVREGKGRKDRFFVIAEKLKDKIKELIKKENLNYEDWLFNSYKKKMYSTRSLQEIIKKGSKKIKLQKKISCHSLRHSFATHLIEDGYSISDVQTLLGHKSPETTFVYIHTAKPKMINVKSPFDNL